MTEPLCIKIDGAWTALPLRSTEEMVVNADGIALSYEALAGLPTSEQEAFGAFRPDPPPTPPKGKVETARTLRPDGDRPAYDVTYGDAPEPGVPASVSETQFMRAATRFKLVTGSEAEDYLARGVIPAFVAAALDKIKDEAERIDARLKVVGATTFFRADALFALLIASGVATAVQIDELFRLADTLN